MEQRCERRADDPPSSPLLPSKVCSVRRACIRTPVSDVHTILSRHSRGHARAEPATSQDKKLFADAEGPSERGGCKKPACKWRRQGGHKRSVASYTWGTVSGATSKGERRTESTAREPLALSDAASGTNLPSSGSARVTAAGAEGSGLLFSFHIER